MFTPRHRFHALLLTLALAIAGAGVAAAAAATPASATATAPWSVRLVAGPHNLRDSTGTVWRSDAAYARGGRLMTTSHRVAGTSTPRLYRAARYGTFSYRFTLQPGTYRVSLNLAEYTYRAPGKRVFAVVANGRTVAARVDAARAVGRLHAYRVRFAVAAPTGALVIRFVHRRGNPAVSSVTLTRRGGAPQAATAAPAVTRAPTASAAPAPSPSTYTMSSTPAPSPSSSTTSSTPAPSPTTSTTTSTPTPTTSAPAPPPTPSPTTSTAAAPTYVAPESFGAVGDGRTDDTTALQRAFDAATATVGVWLAPGRSYAHSRVLDIRVAGAHVTGGGTLLATNEAASSVWADADNVVLDGITVAIASTTRRGETWDQMGVRIVGHSGVVLRNIMVDGSAAAGIYVGNGAGNFLLDHVTVQHTRADGIHMTGGAHNGRVLAPTVISSGDDGVAVVSYGQDGTPCHDITVTAPHVLGTDWGRGLSVVGGTNITETGIDVQNSDAAAVYIGVEGDPWNTAPATNVTISGGTITNANTDKAIDHGAVFVLAGRSGYVSTGITVTGLTIVNTRSTASRDLGVVTYGTSPPKNVLFSNLTITGGPQHAYSGNTAQTSYQLRSITQNGVRLADEG